MSIDIRFIADFITEDTNIFNEDMLIEDDIRRDFLRKVLGTGITGITQGPAKLLKQIVTGNAAGASLKAITKTLTNMSNEELSETPEELWLPYIADGRLKQFMAEHPEHFDNEVVNKFYALVSYLNSPVQTAGGWAKRLIGLMKARADVNPTAILNQALIDDACPFDMFDRNDVMKAAKKIGVNLDINIVNKYYKDHPKQDDEEPTSNIEPDSNAEPEIDQDMWASTVHGGGEPHDKHNASTYKDRYFESKNRHTKYI